MSADVRSFFKSDAAGSGVIADWEVEAGQLAADPGLETAVLLSLFTEADALESDTIPEGEAPRRWWGQSYWPLVPGRLGIVLPAGVQLGSRLWLLRREKQTEQTRSRAIEYARAALAWMIAVGLAAAIDVDAEWQAPGLLAISVVITKPAGLPAKYQTVWRAAA